MSTRLQRTVVLLVLATLVVGAAMAWLRDDHRLVVADFPRTVGLYEGSDVRIMGVTVGEVVSIEPRGTAVRVEMSYAAEHRLPADAKAVIIAPSVIADRFVQLTPVWDGGPVLPDRARLGAERTGVPVELDQTFDATERLLSSLGPEGADADGSVSRVLSVVADVLDGRGAELRRTLADLGDVSQTLAAASGDAGATIENLSEVTDTLAEHDAAVRTFTEDLATVADTLAEDSDDVSSLLTSLAASLGEVEAFVRDNREALGKDVESLSAVTGVLLSERSALEEVLDILPLAFTNLVEAYDPAAASVRTRANFTEIVRAIDTTVCAALEKPVGDAIAPVCDVLGRLLDGLPLRDGLDLPSAPTGQVPEPGPASGSPASDAPTVESLVELLAGLTPDGGRR